jgi:predicted alpha/beta-hydrolase family hydrolase
VLALELLLGARVLGPHLVEVGLPLRDGDVGLLVRPELLRVRCQQRAGYDGESTSDSHGEHYVMSAEVRPLRVPVADGDVSALLEASAGAAACLVLAHGAGAGMEHRFMSQLAAALASRRIATLRFQFPYMERGFKRPDVPAVAQAAVRAAVAVAARELPGVPLFAGGKSFGARMTSQAQAKHPLEGVSGLVFVGFALHPAKKPSVERAAHLREVRIPMLFLQGTRDALAEWTLVEETVRELGERATLQRIEEADHSFHVPARSGKSDAHVLDDLAATTAAWASQRVAAGRAAQAG